MILDPSDLYILVEGGITVIGFTGIIGAVRNRGGTVFSDLERFHLANLLVLSAAVILLAFVPTWVGLLPNAPENIWRVSIVVLFIVHILAWAVATPFVLKGGGVLMRLFPNRDRLGFLIFSAIGILLLLIEAAIVFGHLTQYAALVYLVSVVAALGTALFSFVCLLMPTE